MKKKKEVVPEITEKDIQTIASDITKQLDSLSKYGKFYDDLINEYLYLLSVREKLKADILKKGVRYKFTNGNGKKQEKPNESIVNLIKVEQIMLKIINDLGINQSLLRPSSQKDESTQKGDDEDDLL